MQSRIMLGKALVALLAVLFSVSAYGHKLKEIRRAPDSSGLHVITTAAKKLAKQNKSVVWAAYQIVEVSAVGEAESEESLIARVIKYTLHRDLPMTGNVGGYDLHVLARDADDLTISDAARALPYLSDEDDGLSQGGLTALVGTALKQNLSVYYGLGSGKNTSAEFLAFYDPSTAEFVYIVNSNFGLGDPNERH